MGVYATIVFALVLLNAWVMCACYGNTVRPSGLHMFGAFLVDIALLFPIFGRAWGWW